MNTKWIAYGLAAIACIIGVWEREWAVIVLALGTILLFEHKDDNE